MRGKATFVISLDFELFWGLRDHRRLEEVGPRLLGVRQVVPALLELFQQRGIRATWATVGFLFARSREEILASLPRRLPAYAHRELSPYAHLAEIGANEEEDPYHFAPSLIEAIANAEGQELGSHTFSHYYCLEEGQGLEQFRADLQAHLAIARRQGIILRSLVFPRNQVQRSYLEVCRDLGFTAYRGTPPLWPHQPSSDRATSTVQRLARAADNLLPLTGTRCVSAGHFYNRRPLNVQASRFFRPFAGSSPWLSRLQIRRIRGELDYAATTGGLYHLWWHPHNFGLHLEAHLEALKAILDRFQEWERLGKMESLTMHEVVMGRGSTEEISPPSGRAPFSDPLSLSRRV